MKKLAPADSNIMLLFSVKSTLNFVNRFVVRNVFQKRKFGETFNAKLMLPLRRGKLSTLAN